jgi:integrase
MTAMASFRKRSRVWFYRFIDADGVQRERKGCPDRRATEGMAAAAEAETAKIRAGLIDPKQAAYQRHEVRPLVDHLDDWHTYLIAKGSTRQHALLSRNRVRRIVDLAGVIRLSDLAPSKAQAALKAIRDGGVSLRSVHHYTRAIKGFSRWLWRDGRAREDTLAHLTSPNPDADRRHQRRALSGEELARLVDAAERGPVVLKLGGHDRAMLYRVAMGTGFRANELRSLMPESFDLAGDPPVVTVAASYSKRRRDDAQPIHPALAAVLRSWVASKAAGEPVFGRLTKHTAEMLRHDLEAAGIAYRDASGRVADFHSLRHSYVTALALSGASVKVVQSLARHSTPTLTLGIYSHVGLYDQTGALEALPDLSGTGPKPPEVMTATGTDGPISDRFSLPLPYAGDGPGRDVAVAGGNVDQNASSQTTPAMNRNSFTESAVDAAGRDLADAGESGGGGIRTHGGCDTSTVFKTVPINHSGTPPRCPYCPTTSSRTSSATKIGTSTVTATAMASLGRASTWTISPSCLMRSLA